MEDFVLFNPTWWQALPDGHKEIIKTTFDEVRPEVEKMKEEAAVKSLELIKAANVNVRTADEAERNKLRDATAPAARAAYVSLAGRRGRRSPQDL
jgi:TRAP-type C4-dicarboxylate transport system substrate-binding protein